MHYFAQRMPDGRARMLCRRLHSEAPLEQWFPEHDEWRPRAGGTLELDPVRTGDYTRVRSQVLAAWRAQRRRDRHRRTPNDA